MFFSAYFIYTIKEKIITQREHHIMFCSYTATSLYRNNLCGLNVQDSRKVMFVSLITHITTYLLY